MEMYKRLFDIVLSDGDYEKAIKLGRVEAITKQVIQPRMAKFDKLTGQRNDSKFLAYALMNTLGI